MEKSGDTSDLNLSQREEEGLWKMRSLNKEFLAKNKGSDEVRDFLSKAGSDNSLLLTYLRGRKYKAEYAWETLKRYAEVRFNDYPEVFVKDEPKCLSDFRKKKILGILKKRDSLGRRVMCSQGRDWDPHEYPIVEVTQACVHLVEFLLKDEDAIENGVIYIQNCDGMGMVHAKQYTLPAMMRVMHVFWFACPLKFKAIYFVNVPYYLTFVYRLIKPFFPKKLKERFILTTTNMKFTTLHEHVNPECLPKFLDGDDDSLEVFEKVS